jgi:hypothetical protein
MRRVGARPLVVLAAVLLVGASLAGYARLAVFNSGQFADRASAALQDDSVRTLIGERVTDDLVLSNDADLIAARPLISAAAAGIVGADAFRNLFRRAVLDAHRAVFNRDRDTLTLTLADVGTVIAAALEKLNPELARQLDAGERVVLLKRDLGRLTADIVRTGERLRVIAWVLAFMTLAAAIAALVVSHDRRRTAGELGIGLAAAGMTLVVLFTLARALLVDSDAARGVWDAFFGDLRSLGWLYAAAGVVVAAAASSLIKPVEVEGSLLAAWRIVTTEPAAAWLRLVRAAALVATGLLMIARPLAMLQIAVTLAGVYVLYKGLEPVLRMIYQPRPDTPPAPEGARPRPHRARRIAVPVLAVLLVAVAVVAYAAGGGTEAPAQAVSKCNGRAPLCDRPLTDVALAATHNSMSVPLPGWYSAEQERPIGGQLEDGIHGLLLDTHYGDRLASGRVRTYFGTEEDQRRAVTQDGVSPEAVESALHLRDRLGFRGEGRRGMYLCHSFCELGATPLADGLVDIHRFLATHPAEVVVVINQDYVTPADFVGAIEDAGLTRYAFTPPAAGQRWPSLREMIESGKRLVLLAENRAGAAPWYQLAYERLTQETPFHFDSAAELIAASHVCPPNRGTPGAPLFLLNQWVTTSPVQRPSDAAKVNAYEPLLARAEACRRIRKTLPNLIAVNFYKEGDVFEVVDRLNGVGGS